MLLDYNSHHPQILALLVGAHGSWSPTSVGYHNIFPQSTLTDSDSPRFQTMFFFCQAYLEIPDLLHADLHICYELWVCPFWRRNKQRGRTVHMTTERVATTFCMCQLLVFVLYAEEGTNWEKILKYIESSG